jgi:hypothetical protein
MEEEEEILHAHKHTLSERCESLNADVEKITDGCLSFDRLRISLPEASQYLAFLSGQPMYVHELGSNINSDWYALHEIQYFSEGYDDFDAQDECVDGMREILENWRAELTEPFDPLQFNRFDFGTPLGRLVVDYMVHRSCDVKQWIDRYHVWDYNDESSFLQEALSKKFAEEARRKKDKIGEPDLTERCRYHWHVTKDLPCCLDK